jgi:hypothetical protein
MKKYIYFFLLLALMSCTTLYPPDNHNIVKSKTFNQNYEEIWSRVIDWFAKNNIPIKNLEKASGFINTETGYGIDSNYCDCGIIEIARTKYVIADKYNNDIVGNYNIVVKKFNDSLTKVDVNMFFRTVVVYNNSLSPGTTTKKVDCISKGVYENSLFQYLEHPY